jgi:hypothetical protein
MMSGTPCYAIFKPRATPPTAPSSNTMSPTPRNRLVTAGLELRWNRALERVAELDRRIDADDFAALAGDLKAVWEDPTTDVRLKKRIVRTLIHEVVADIEPEAGEIILVLHWADGLHTELRLPRRRRGQRNSTATQIIEAVRVLVRIANDDVIAGLLNRNGLTTGHGNRWTRERVTALRSHHKIPVYRHEACDVEGWMTLTPDGCGPCHQCQDAPVGR